MCVGIIKVAPLLTRSATEKRMIKRIKEYYPNDTRMNVTQLRLEENTYTFHVNTCNERTYNVKRYIHIIP